MKTLQEAIWLTSSIGVRFIWIDSVCITQDSAEGSAAETASTADVYRSVCVPLLLSMLGPVQKGS